MGLFTRKRKFNQNENAKSRPSDLPDFGFSRVLMNVGANGDKFSKEDRIASQVAMLSWGIYRGYGKYRQQIYDHPLARVIKRPSYEEHHFNFFYQSTIDYFRKGIFWKIGKGTQGQIVSLFRLNPNDVVVDRDDNGNRVFRYNGKVYTQEEIFYVPSRWGYNTRSGGQSIDKAASGTFDIAKDLDQFTRTSFVKGISGQRLVVDVSEYEDMTEKQKKDIRNKYMSTYGGAENEGIPLLSTKKDQYSYIGKGTDNRAQTLIENRQFQEKAINNVYGYPNEFKDLETFNTCFLEDAVRPIATEMQEIINDMFDFGDNAYFEFNYNSLLKVSLSQRVDAYSKELSTGQLTLNEVRAKENLPPLPEAGDTAFVPANWMPWNEETKEAYMAKQKNEAQKLKDGTNQHIPQGDDKQ